MLVYMCMNWKEQHPEESGAEHVPLHGQIRVLVRCWECRQDKLSRHLPLLRLPDLPAPQKACALSRHESSLKSSFGAACSGSC